MGIPCLLDGGTKIFLHENVANKSKDGMVFVEVGSFLGGSICHLGSKIKELGKNVKLYAVDNWRFDNISTGHLELTKSGQNYLEQFKENVNSCGLEVEAVVGDSIEIAKSGKFAEKSIDFIFIDGNHTYPYVRDELLAWLPYMKEDSVILCHDYNGSEGIRQAAKEIFGLNNLNFTENRDSYFVNMKDFIKNNG